MGNYFKFRRRATPLDQFRDRDATTIDTNNGSPLRPTFALPFFVFAWAYPPPLQLSDLLTNPPEGDRSGGGAGLGLGGVEEKLRKKRVEEKSRAEARLDFGSSIGGCSP